MSLEVCEECTDSGASIYRCNKCGAPLCRHHIRTHVCSSPSLGLRGEQSPRREGAHISEKAWKQLLKKQRVYNVKIQSDLNFLVEFPWFPFTKLNAWVPVRRPHYKGGLERSRSLNIEELFTYLEKEKDSVQYDRKFFYDPYVEEQFNIWQRNWKKMNGYWEHKRTHRPTKFELKFPQLASEDLEILRKAGCKIHFATGAKQKLKKLEKSTHKKFMIKVQTVDERLRIVWNDDFNTWFHTLFNVFIRYMAVRSEDDPEADYIDCIRQIGPQEIEIDYWAAFRANHFWRIVKETIKKSKTLPLFDLQYQPFKPPSKKWNIKIEEIYTLRSYQEKGIEKWIKNRYFGTIQLPTGAGKTLLGIDAISRIQERTLILVPNLALVDQWTTQIRRFLSIPVERIGIFNGQKKAFREFPVVISTYQLLSQYLQDFHAIEKKQTDEVTRDKITVLDTIGFFTHKFGLVIADEAHHIQAETFRQIAVDLEIPRRMALSATIEKSVNSSLVIATMGPIIHKVSYGLLAREGYIAPIYFKRIQIPLTAEEKGLLKKKGKKAYGKVSREAYNKLIAIHKLLKSPITSQTLIFTSRIKHAMKIHSFLKDKGIENTVLTGHTVVNDRELNQILDQFRNGKIHTLVLVKMLNEGFDAPADTIIVVSGTRNRREQIQRFGRATRPGKVAKLFELIIEPLELDYEYEVSKARDISDIIEPHVQDILLPVDEKEEIDDLVAGLKRSFFKSEKEEILQYPV
ncbi:MAG: DEAD/DEAH box helicase family protein [Candidatus Hodarchaeota archaeon]